MSSSDKWILDAKDSFLEGHSSPVVNVTFSEDGRYLAGDSLDQQVIVWDIKSQNIISKYKYDFSASHVMFVNNDLVLKSGNQIIKTDIDQTKREVLFEIKENSLLCLFYSHSIEKFIAIDSNGLLLTWDQKNNFQSKEILIDNLKEKSLLKVIISRNERSLFIGFDNGEVIKLNLESIKKELFFKTDLYIKDFNISSDEKNIIIGTGDNKVYLWDIKGNKQLFCKEGPLAVGIDDEEGIASVVFSPNDQYFIAGSEMGIITIWDIQDGKKHLSFDTLFNVAQGEFADPVYLIAFSPLNKSFVVNKDNGLWLFYGS